MCGICGIAYADRERPVDPEALRRMTTVLAHRGPDGEGRYLKPGIGLGVRRLAMVDLAGGEQPIASEDGRVVAIVNGEIYDHDELRRELGHRGHELRTRSDAEALVHLYEDVGIRAVEWLRGMFAFALWDEGRRRLVLARDRLGIKPLHYAVLDDRLVFGSEAKAILAEGGVAPRLDPDALHDLLHYGFVRSPRSSFAGIHRLGAGEILVWEAGRLDRRRWRSVDFPDPPARERSEAEWAEALRAALEDSVRLHVRGDVPLGAWLSGGLDSSAVAALAHRATGAEVDAFSVAFDDPGLDEVASRPTLAELPGSGIRGHRATCGPGDVARLARVLWHVEDPSANGIEIPRSIASETAAAAVKGVLSGEGADELLGGYWWYRADRLLRPLGRLPRRLRRGLARRAPAGERWRYAADVLAAPRRMGPERYAAMVGPRHQGRVRSLLAREWRDRPAEEPGPPPGVDPERFATWHPFQRLQAWDLAVRLPDLILRKVDQASMAYGLEVRVPFLDPEVVDLCAAMPPGVKAARPEKRVLRRAMAEVLPAEIADRRKAPLRAPHAAWLRGPLPEPLAELLTGRALERTGVFRPPAVAGILERHRSGAGEYGDLLWAVLTVQAWHAVFVERRGPGAALPA